MISALRIFDYVVEILKAADRPMLAKDICVALQSKGVIIERPRLTQLLWNHNPRTELVVDKDTFKWRYDREAAQKIEEAEKRNEGLRRELGQHDIILDFWETVGLEFLGVWRERTEKPFFSSEKIMTITGSLGQKAICFARGQIYAQNRTVISEAIYSGTN
jgi:hypothetical protein